MLQAALDDCNAAVRLSTGKRHREALNLRAQIQTCLQNHEVSCWMLCAVAACLHAWLHHSMPALLVRMQSRSKQGF